MFAPSGSGKTYSALRFAAGLSKTGKVCMINTERGRGSIYADNKRILSELPQGYSIIEVDQPYHPKVCIEAMDLAESGGYDVCLIDNGSDFWDGPGGCTDLAEAAKNMWNVPKLWNKRMMTRAGDSDMHIIWLFKAQDKTKIIDKKNSASGKQEYIELGMQPITERNNTFPQLLVFFIDPTTHMAKLTKCTDDLWGFFPEPKLLTKADGEAVRKWNEGAQAVDANEQLQKRGKAAAESGMEAYKNFFASLPTQQKQVLTATTHEENKTRALEVDAEANANEEPADDISSKPALDTIKSIGAFERKLPKGIFGDILQRENFAVLADIETEQQAVRVLAAMTAELERKA